MYIDACGELVEQFRANQWSRSRMIRTSMISEKVSTVLISIFIQNSLKPANADALQLYAQSSMTSTLLLSIKLTTVFKHSYTFWDDGL